MPDDPAWLEPARALTGASSVTPGPRIQSLWSGYGEIARAHLDGQPVIVKHVCPPGAGTAHPRGWATDRSHQRKLRSYDIELAWYSHHAARCAPDTCRVPATVAATALDDGGWLFVLEDLDAAGFPERRGGLSPDTVAPCLRWLAGFHATFLGHPADDLWPTGTYWHLDTRPDELAALPASDPLKHAAPQIDALLAACPHQTLVHGDAKVANFCFSPDGSSVATVDFQYIGGGPGIKDVAYFLGSCLDEHTLARHESALLDTYFTALGQCLTKHQPGTDPTAVATAWRDLYPAAWTDFERFLAGWCPGHPKQTTYSRALATRTLNALA